MKKWIGLILMLVMVGSINAADLKITKQPFSDNYVVDGTGITITKNANSDDYTINASNVTPYLPLSGGTVTGATNFEAAVGVGKSDGSGGANLNVYATLDIEMVTAPMVTGGWTMTDGWSITAGVLSRAGGTTTGTATAVSGMTLDSLGRSITAGVVYKVVIVCSAAANSPTYTLGGVTGTTITATTITDYITASTTAKIIFSGGSTATATISSVSVKALTNATGDLTVDGNIILASQILGRNSGSSSAAPSYPMYSFINYPTIGLGYSPGWGALALYDSTGLLATFSDGLNIQRSTGVFGFVDVFFYRDAAYTMALRNGASQQIYRLYNTYTNASNYERLTLTGVAGGSVNLTAETAGTGGDNLDIILTPAGTGALKSVTKFVHSGTPDIVSAAGAISVQTAITHVVTNGVGTVLTLAAGVEGQVKYIVLKTLTSASQTDVITPDGGGAGFTTITMAALGQAVTLLYTNAKWTIVGSFGVVIA